MENLIENFELLGLQAEKGFDDGINSSEIYIGYQDVIFMTIDPESKTYVINRDIDKPKKYLFVETRDGALYYKVRILMKICTANAFRKVQKGDYDINIYQLESIRSACLSRRKGLTDKYKETMKFKKQFVTELNMLCKHLSENGYKKIRKEGLNTW